MNSHINTTVKTCFYYLRLLGKLCLYINQQTANTIAVSLVHSRLDYCNSILYGLPVFQLQRLQHVQNIAARIVTRLTKTDHTTPILKIYTGCLWNFTSSINSCLLLTPASMENRQSICLSSSQPILQPVLYALHLSPDSVSQATTTTPTRSVPELAPSSLLPQCCGTLYLPP